MRGRLSVLLLFSIILLIPPNVLAQTVNEDHKGIDISIITPDGDVGPVGIVDELEQGHSDITSIMITNEAAIVNEGYVDEEVFYEATYVDYENERLVVWLDPAQMFDPVSVDDIQEDLGLDIPIEIIYGYFEPEASSSQATTCPADSGSSICYYWGRYVDRCLPDRTTSRCSTYSTIITGAGYALPTLLSGSTPVDSDNDGIPNNVDTCPTQPETENGYLDSDGCPDTPPAPTPTLPPTPSTTGTVVFSEDFESGLGRWTESGQREWQTGTPDDGVYVPGLSSSNRVAEADDCDDEACILTLSSPIDLRQYSSATLEFWRFVDRGLDRNEYLEVQLGNSGSYSQIFRWTDRDGDDHTWHKETYNLSNYLGSASFTIRFLTEQSKSSEDVGIDGVKITATPKETTQCTLDVDARLQGDDVLVSWNDCGDDIRRYKVYLIDDGNRYYRSSVYSDTSYTYTRGQEGETYSFAVKAQYREDNSYTPYFTSNSVTIPVSDRIPPTITVPNGISLESDSSDGRTVTYVATAYDGTDGTIVPNCTPASGTMFAVGDTTVTCTARDSAGNTASKSFVVNIRYETTTTTQCSASNFQSHQSGGICDIELETIFSGSLQGGKPMVVQGTEIYPNGTRDYLAYAGTITTAIRDASGNPGFLVSSHTLHTPYMIDPQIGLIYPPGNFSEIGVATQDPNILSSNNSPYLADIAFVRITDRTPPPISYNQIDYVGRDLTVNSHGGLANLEYGSPVYIAGSYNDGVGGLQYKNATVIFASSTLIKQGLANYPSEMGDSGAPIFRYDGSNVNILGAHAGLGCKIVELDNGRTPPFSYVHNMTNVCDLTNSTPFKVFSPWENIQNTINLQ